ncbi:lytic murein transglycosylase [Shewanella sp.]|uniref:lytic murein transglycosylase n=1 Tax=Shewanella sp. TaxID=50422 RepID=UPI003A96EBB0
MRSRLMGIWCAIGVTVSLLLPLQASAQSFEQFLPSLLTQAKNEGVDAKLVDELGAQTKLFRRATVKQASYASLEQYIPAMVSDAKVNAATQLYQQHKDTFLKLSHQYGVQPRFILAQWAMLGAIDQTGTGNGVYPLLSVVASSAYEGDESAAREYVDGVKLIADGRYSFDTLLADRDGTIGPLKLRASMLLGCAVDGDTDGTIDMWHSALDIYASAASCLHANGWDDSQTWGRQVKAPAALLADTGFAIQKTFDAWQKAGVTRYDGGELPNRSDMQVSLLMPDGANGRQYMVYQNYRTLYALHADHYLVLAMVHLSERLKKLGVE